MTRPKSAGVGLLFFASLRGKSVLSRRHRHSSLPRNDFLLYHKIRSAAENAARTDSPPQTYPGSLCRTLLVSILLYEQPRQIWQGAANYPQRLVYYRASKQWKTGLTYFPLFGRRQTPPCPSCTTRPRFFMSPRIRYVMLLPNDKRSAIR